MLQPFHKGVNRLGELNKVVEGVNANAQGVLAGRRDGRNVPHLSHGFIARIAADNGDGTFDFAEVYLDSDGETWQTVDGGVGAEDADLARPFSGSAAVGDIVRMWSGQAEGGAPAYWFVGPAGGAAHYGIVAGSFPNVEALPTDIDVHPCEDADGTNPDTSTTLTVHVLGPPSRAAALYPADWPTSGDPAMVVGYVVDAAGELVALGDYADDPLGTVKPFIGTAWEVPRGWYVCDGNNGTPDLRDRFLAMADTKLGEGAGGESEHWHTLPLHRHEVSSQVSSTVDVTTVEHEHDFTSNVHQHTFETESEDGHTHTGTDDFATVSGLTDPASNSIDPEDHQLMGVIPTYSSGQGEHPDETIDWVSTASWTRTYPVGPESGDVVPVEFYGLLFICRPIT
jgi:hypothetical protein